MTIFVNIFDDDCVSSIPRNILPKLEGMKIKVIDFTPKLLYLEYACVIELKWANAPLIMTPITVNGDI